MTAEVEMVAKEGEGIVNEHAPPSSAEEAAALLGAAISSDALTLSSLKEGVGGGRSNPPQGMHSVFTVQTPVPNQILFVRLVNLRAWLRWHADASKDSPDVDGLDDGVSVFIVLVIIFDIGNFVALIYSLANSSVSYPDCIYWCS
jgi:hypothetical protein